MYVDSNVLVDDPSATVPSLTTDLSGNVYLTWISSQNDSAQLFFKSRTPGGEWSEPVLISSGEDWFVNWADYPSLATAQGELLYAHYLKKSGPGTYHYDIFVRKSTDGGVTWPTEFTLNEDGVKAEHGFVSMAPSGNDMYMAWLDGRHAAEEDGAMTLRAALFSPEGMRKGEWELDNRVCDCCQTAMAMTDNGPIVVYRDRSPNEFRDIAIVRFEKYKWTQPNLIYRDAWQINACPVNGPKVDASGNDLAIAWFTGGGESPSVKVIFSPDGGKTFTTPIRLNTHETIGRTDIVLLKPGLAAVSWMENDLLRTAVVNQNGSKLNEWTIAELSSSRSSGFPQITLAGDSLLVAWNNTDERRIKAAYLPL